MYNFLLVRTGLLFAFILWGAAYFLIIAQLFGRESSGDLRGAFDWISFVFIDFPNAVISAFLSFMTMLQVRDGFMAEVDNGVRLLSRELNKGKEKKDEMWARLNIVYMKTTRFIIHHAYFSRLALIGSMLLTCLGLWFWVLIFSNGSFRIAYERVFSLEINAVNIAVVLLVHGWICESIYDSPSFYKEIEFE